MPKETYFSLATLATLLILTLPRPSWCAPRASVVQLGTTLSPLWRRLEGTPLAPCPDSHPWAMANGTLCCDHGLVYPHWPRPDSCAVPGYRTSFFEKEAECCRVGGAQECQFYQKCGTNKPKAVEGKD